ncbi:MAG: MotA/TolQ/ExbB proton channel family protein [Deltaproteobacteria bacterium]|nr:MotA/TolQ/ExbB proton channel family protein [Deltaproteobacteria bacterium]
MPDIAEIINYLKPGGILMIPLITLSFLMWLMILDKIVLFRNFNCKFENSSDSEEIEKDLNKLRHDGSILISDFINAFLKERTGFKDFDKAIIKRNMLLLKPAIYKNLDVIFILSAVAPLFGLLGTVTGMIHTFDVINIFGNGNSSGMAIGIKEALITTQGGLFIAIPGIFMSYYLEKKAEAFENSLNQTSVKLQRVYC